MIVRILNNIRLAFFPIAYALSGVLIGSTLNRIMIADLEHPASLVALFFAIPLLVSPIRIWIGYRSDGYPILGKRREPYIIIGALVIGLGVLSISSIITRTAETSLALAGGVGLAFLLYGLGRNIGHNTFQALVADRFSGDARSRAATLYEVATMVGMIAGAGAIKGALKVYEPSRLVAVSVGVAAVVFLLAVFSALGQEKKDQVISTAAEGAREVKFGEAFKRVIMSDPQVRLFFGIVMLTFIGTLAQDVLLEPYGGLVLGMDVGETTGLTQFWGVGVLAAMLVSGIILLKWLGFMRLMRTGMAVAVIAFAGTILVGVTGNVGLFKVVVLVMGIGTGLAGAGMLAGTLTFTTRLRAGMLLGVWAVANMAGHALGSLTGGVIVDSVRLLTGSALAAYVGVFALEVVLLLVAFSLTFRLDIASAHASFEELQKLKTSPIAAAQAAD